MPVKNLVYYCLVQPLGFLYVSWCTVQKPPSHTDTLVSLLVAPFWFFLSGIFTFKPHDDKRHFVHNQLVWFSAYCVGLHFTYLDTGTLQQFTLTPTSLDHWPQSLWYLFLALIVVLGVIAGYLGFLYRDCLRFYFVITFTFILVAQSSALVYGRDCILHVHHYSLAALCMVYCGWPNTAVGVMHGLANGVMIEGVARWGYAPIWEEEINAT